MIVFDDINSKDIDEFVYWLDEVGMHDCSLWVKWWDDNYCNKCR